MHERSLGIMPADTVSSATMRRASASVRLETSEPLSWKSSYRPSTSVRKTTLWAPMAAAMCPAAMSAFTL